MPPSGRSASSTPKPIPENVQKVYDRLLTVHGRSSATKEEAEAEEAA